MEWRKREVVGSCYLVTFNCCDENFLTKITFKRKDLFGLTVPERWESIIVGSMAARSRLVQDAEEPHLKM